MCQVTNLFFLSVSPPGFQAAGGPGCPERSLCQRRHPARSWGVTGCWPAALPGHQWVLFRFRTLSVCLSVCLHGSGFSGHVKHQSQSKGVFGSPQVALGGLLMWDLQASCWPPSDLGRSQLILVLFFSPWLPCKLTHPQHPPCLPAAGFTVGWTTLSFACSRGWSRTASRTRSCTKGPLSTLPTNPHGLHDPRHWKNSPSPLWWREETWRRHRGPTETLWHT